MADMGMLSFQTPEEVAAARRAAEDARNIQMSQMGLGQSARYGMLSAGSALGNAVGAATGYVDPNEARAQKTQQVMSSPDSDLNTSKGMLAKAAELRTIDPRLSMQLLLKGRELEKQEQAAALAARKQDTLDAAQLSLTKLQAAQAEKALRENPNLREIEVGVAGKPDYRQKMIIDSRDPNAKPVLVGEPYQIAAGVRVDARSGGGSTGSGGMTPPKNLTREARLKWEFDNGMIDQATYDQAMAANPGGKLANAKQEAATNAITHLDNVESNLLKLLDPKTKKLTGPATSLFGSKMNQYRGSMTLGQDSVDAMTSLDALKDQVMLSNLQEAKARVGQSFGSMQLKEWDKFTNQLRSLNRAMSEESAAANMADILKFIRDKKDVMRVALGEGVSAPKQPTAPPVPKTAVPASKFNARWATLKSGQSLTGPDGKTYTKK